jgi:peroxiredoxin
MKRYIVHILLSIILISSCSLSTDDQHKLKINFKQNNNLGYKDVLAGVAINSGYLDKYNPEKLTSFPLGYEIVETFRIPFQNGQYQYYLSKTDSNYLNLLKNIRDKKWFESSDSLYTTKWVDCVVSMCLLKDSLGNKYIVVDENNDENLTNDPILKFHEKTIRSGIYASKVKAINCSAKIEYFDGTNIKKRNLSFLLWNSEKNSDWLFLALLERQSGEVEINGQKISIELVSLSDIEYSKYSHILVDLNGNGTKDENDNFGQLVIPVSLQDKIYNATNIDRFGKNILLEFDTLHVPVLNNQTASSFLKKGSFAPDFKASTIDSLEFKLSNFKGNFVLVQFWAPWCGPCTREIPHIRNVFDKFHNKGLKIVSIGIDKPEKLYRYIKYKSEDWIHISQAKNDEIVKLYHVNSIPKLYLLNKDGKIIEDEISLRGEKLEKTIGEYFTN